jgi:hypothetical protein
MFTSIVMELDMQLGGNLHKFETTLEDAKQYCMVLNSLRVPVVVETQVNAEDDVEELDEDDIIVNEQLPPPLEMWPGANRAPAIRQPMEQQRRAC